MAGKKKYSKASKQAAQALKGSAVTPEQDLVLPERVGSRRAGRSWLNRPVAKGMRITWKAVMLFMLCCLILDLILFTIVQFGFDQCYGILCMIG